MFLHTKQKKKPRFASLFTLNGVIDLNWNTKSGNMITFKQIVKINDRYICIFIATLSCYL